MRRVKFPHCVKCGAELNPNKYEDCEKYYLTDDGIMCRIAFLTIQETGWKAIWMNLRSWLEFR